MTADPRQIAVERAVKVAALARLAREIGIAEALAVIATAGGVTPRESVAAVCQSRQQQMIVELNRLEQEGRGRAAPMLVARKFVADPRDPIEVEILARDL